MARKRGRDFAGLLTNEQSVAACKDGICLHGSVMEAVECRRFQWRRVIKPFERGQVARRCGGERGVNLKVGAP